MEIVYFELNNWMSGRDYPNTEPFTSWLHDDLLQTLANDEWAKKNKLCIIAFPLDMSCNYLITATKDWVLENCPDLLSNKEYDVTFQRGNGVSGWQEVVEHHSFKQFLRFPDPEDNDEFGDGPVFGRGDVRFAEYKEENFGVTWKDDPYLDDIDDEDDE